MLSQITDCGNDIPKTPRTWCASRKGCKASLITVQASAEFENVKECLSRLVIHGSRAAKAAWGCSGVEDRNKWLH